MENLPKLKYLYQFGDPLYYNILQDPHSYLWRRVDWSQSMGISVKSRSSELPFSNGQIWAYGSSPAYLDGQNLSTDVVIGSDEDLDYLKLTFVGKTKKIFLFEKYRDEYKIFANFLSYQQGLNGDAGESTQTDERLYSYPCNFFIENPLFLDITNEVFVLDHRVLDGNVYPYTTNIPWANYTFNPVPNFNYTEDYANYKLKFSDLSEKEKGFYLGNYCNESPEYYLSWQNSWVGEVDINSFPTTNTQATTLSTNNVTSLSLSDLDLNSTDINRIWKIKITQSGGLANGDSIKIENPNKLSGFILTWTGVANSSANIMINTAQDYIWDLDKNRKINPNNYTLQLAKSNYSKILTVEPTTMPRVNPNPNLQRIIPQINLTKNSSANMTITLSNLKTFYI